MPNWFKKQMTEAYHNKNLYQIKVLNQCWFFYRDRIL
ncbi:cortex morphogenetic protein CmpA [Aquibacillus koreensis]|uniref:Cortex morphogenetic protein CmpA n=1 Tax=Aquibacillus koreensis TaxID=279446 RepID=A0A9X3WRR2_9BACI|nr:cortex morphogenetic protein CmpA [Aquibacillus koreensis]MCT2534972.1 cortex morphogenetic protein CmpA [Aquibacillus koreensis]MDC3422134.1 cortex morphogenetic protein CmpA [Aquibacillus koreensis]